MRPSRSHRKQTKAKALPVLPLALIDDLLGLLEINFHISRSPYITSSWRKLWRSSVIVILTPPPPHSTHQQLAHAKSKILNLLAFNHIATIMSLISVSDVLGTNHALNEHDCLVVEKSLSEQEQLLEQVRAQKADLEQQLLVINQREAQIVKVIADHRTLLRASPIRSLPAELLGEIFLAHCADFDVYNSSGATFRKSRLRLLWVCTRWRDVALSTPRIWVALSVDCTDRYSRIGTRSRISELKRWVSSSGRLPLSINFRFTEYRNLEPISIFNTIFAELYRCKCFFGDLDFEVEGGDAAQRVIDQDIPNAPILETLSLRSYRAASNLPMINWRQKLYAKIPRLHHLDIDSARGIVSLPVQNITTVKLGTATLGDIFYLLENAAVLEEFSVGEVGEVEQHRHDRHDCRRLDRLVRVHFQQTASTVVNQFIDYVTLPSIKELTIRATLSWPHAESFMRFFERSACSLTKLNITAPGADEHGFLLDILPFAPSLQVLHIENRDYHFPSPLPSLVLEYLTGKPKRQNLTALTDLQVSVQLRQMAGVKKLLDYRRTNWEKLGVGRLDHLSITIITARLSATQMKDRRQQMLEVFEPYGKAGLTYAIRSR
ncbi:hypothetical protein EV421DRAFT_1732665 [Armillaria borealis]|uniref:F-box domain-containing protein n=1 Tax=Armillaria borealis TaxID=47425 RepID=A0AA39JV79_9AGAR|nr:hypothetical protein EV421DRAFT_1732665 [Armillaria borealis]